MRSGERFPRLAVGQLPAPRAAPGSVDAAELRARARRTIDSFARAWRRFEADQRGDAATSEGPRAAADVPLATYRQTRRQALHAVADLADLADEVRADRLRAAAAQQAEWGARGWTDAMADGDLDAVQSAFEAVLDRAGDDEVRCRWSRAHAGLRLQRVAWTLENRNYCWEMAYGDEPDDIGAAEAREAREVERAWERFEDPAWRWPREASAVAR